MNNAHNYTINNFNYKKIMNDYIKIINNLLNK